MIKLLAWPSIASKNWVYRQYDHQVRDGSVVLPGSDAAVIRIKTDSLPVMSAELAAKVGDPTVSEKLIAMTVDCNGGYVYLDPYEGAKIAVAEACRNLACSGAIPLGATDNLNMPSPLKPELFWQIKESVRGLAEGCKAFNAPVTGGNCSLYNQSPAGPIDPTPTISVVGLIEKLEHVTTQWFKDEGDAIILLGEAVDKDDPIFGLGGSAYLQVVHGKKNGSPPRCDLEVAKTLHTTLIGLIQSGLVKSAHDCSEGGLAVALAESCISQLIARETPRLIGATIDLSLVETTSTSSQTGRWGRGGTRPYHYAPRRVALRRNAIAHRHQLQGARRRESRRTRQAHGRARGANRQSRRRQADGENRQRRILRPAHRTARRVVEQHRPRDGVTFFERKRHFPPQLPCPS